MKTRTLLLLSVGTALMILVAGGVLLFQLSSQEATTRTTPLGTRVQVGDAEIVVSGSSLDGAVLRVDVEAGGVADEQGIETFALVTGDQRLDPLSTRSPGRCTTITIEAQTCSIDFDVSASEGTSRVLVVRRGEEQATWRLT
ncbi:MAG: hypothetical protein ABJ382_15370 [Ilumatobacter sp.]